MPPPEVLRYGFVEASIPAGTLLTISALQWKKYLTTMQIVQFVIDLFVVYFGSKSANGCAVYTTLT